MHKIAINQQALAMLQERTDKPLRDVTELKNTLGVAIPGLWEITLDHQVMKWLDTNKRKGETYSEAIFRILRSGGGK